MFTRGKQGVSRATALDDGPDDVTQAALAAEGLCGLLDAARLLRDLRWFDAALPTSILADYVARLLRGPTADALRELLSASDDLSAAAKRAALVEPLCAPAAAPAALAGGAPSARPPEPAPPQPTRSVSLAMDGDDPFEGNMRACLERCDARTLRELKAVSVAWQRRAREVLGDAASAWRQRPIWSPSAEGRALVAQLPRHEYVVHQGGGNAMERMQVLQRMGRELDRAVELPGHALAVVQRLSDPVAFVRMAAVQTLGKLEVAVLRQHEAALDPRLDDSAEWVRFAAVLTLGKLSTDFSRVCLAPHEQALAKAATDDEDAGVRSTAAELLAKLRAGNN